jgi:excisionase family DNA binding protein
VKQLTQRGESSDPFTTLKALIRIREEGDRAMQNVKDAHIESMPETLLTRSEVAQMLGVSPTTVTRWAREGRLACRVTLGGHHRFSRSLVEEVRENMSRGVPVTPLGQR